MHTEQSKAHTSISFTLAPTIYAAKCEGSIILLDIKRDKYFSLIEDAAEAFEHICQNEVVFNNSVYSCKEKYHIDKWVKEFLSQEYLVVDDLGERRTIGNLPLQSGGLANYQWDSKYSWKPFSKASKILILPAFLQLSQIHGFLKKQNMTRGIETIESFSSTRLYKEPTQAEIDRLAAAVDAASLMYPIKTYCLAWSLTFCLLALKKRWAIDFFIGVQSNPFYAHAWVEYQGKVINDDPRVREYLSIIYRGPTR